MHRHTICEVTKGRIGEELLGSDHGAGNVGVHLRVADLFPPIDLGEAWLSRQRFSRIFGPTLNDDMDTTTRRSQSHAALALRQPCDYFSSTTVQQWECWEK